jgi:hypothetical protein
MTPYIASRSAATENGITTKAHKAIDKWDAKLDVCG